MAIIELQIRKDAFVSYVVNEINRQRLPARSVDAFEEIKGKLLQRIECTGATVEPSAGANRVVVQADLVFHHNTFAEVRAAGSLQLPVTQKFERTLPVTIAIAFDNNGVPSVGWSIFNGAVPGRTIPLDLPSEIGIVAGAVVADDAIVAIRLGTRADDPVDDTIVDRLGTADWAQLIGGQAIADVFARHFAEAIAGSLSDDLTLDTAAAGAWFPAFGALPARAGVSATVVAVDACVFDIDVPVDLQLTATFQPTGASMLTTVTISWAPDSTICEIVAGLLLTPIASIAINRIAKDKTSERLLGTSQPFAGFTEVSRSDESISYQRTAVIDTVSPRFVLERTEITDEGILTAGSLRLQSARRSLEGEVTQPSSGLKRDCGRRTVTVEFRHPAASLRDAGVEGGPPRLLADGVLFDPPGCWRIVPGPSNTWLDLTLKFEDPPGGRLPAGTSTSVFLHTDCGLRWLDLGTIPADRPAPGTGEIAEMLSHCMAISDRWGMGVLNLQWLIDPPEVLRGLEPLRLWTVAVRGIPAGTPIDFVAVGADGSERRLAVHEGSADVAVDLVTDVSETLQIRTARQFEGPAPVVWQRWMVPFAEVPIHTDRAHLASAGGLIGVGREGEDSLMIEMSPDGRLRAESLSPLKGDDRVQRLQAALGRSQRRAAARPGTATTARLDRETIAVADRGVIRVGRALPAVRM